MPCYFKLYYVKNINKDNANSLLSSSKICITYFIKHLLVGSYLKLPIWVSLVLISFLIVTVKLYYTANKNT